jgi:hypothetical protein
VTARSTPPALRDSAMNDSDLFSSDRAVHAQRSVQTTVARVLHKVRAALRHWLASDSLQPSEHARPLGRCPRPCPKR